MDPPSPPAFANLHWNDFLVASLIGLPDVEIDRLLEESQARMRGDAPSDTDEPDAKRPRISTEPAPPIPVRRRISLHRHLQFRSGLTFHFSEDDGKDILTPPSQEPNLFLRKLLSKLPTSLRGRLQFLSPFHPEEVDPSQYDVVDADLVETDEWIVPQTPADLHPLDYIFPRGIREDFYYAYLREMRLRRAFRTLLQRWRIRRIHRKPLSSPLDPITLQPPEKPILLYDFSQQTRYVYDAPSLSAWIEANLTHHEGGFSTPQPPRNPWTNLPFTYVHLLSIYLQLQAYGSIGWALTTFRHHHFHLARWRTYHSTALTLLAIRQSLTRLDTSHARDMLADFIFMKMDDLHIYHTPHIQRVYHQAIQHCPTHWYLEAFKGVAYQHYEAEHFGQNRFRYIHNRSDQIFRKQEAFLNELRCKGIGLAEEEQEQEQEQEE